ncbi:methionine ABC transporter permease [Bariatricus sp. SGI.161]|uniref:methionine ABC transporter permease n=1 Tax=Bariatricus sp. SGI.161 TaxID=3420550 RepID=UPI002A8C0D8B|nr:ABC transporter permease [Lachnospiraceae bacterium]MDY4208095.1 methionine ABC transporter permease [Lachnospiraceae bacterium]
MSRFLTEYQLNFWERVLSPAFLDTIEMVAITTLFGTIFGFLIAVILLVSNKDGIRPNKYIYGVVSFLVNVIRSFPFLILMILLLPFTKLVAGTSIGVRAAVVPLIVSAAAFIAKLIENAMQEVDRGLIEAMKSFGISEAQVVFRVMLTEALPSIISGIILAMVSILGCTAMAGAMGAGGIGSVAITYGYQKFNYPVMGLTVAILIIFVEIIEAIGKWVYRKMK